VLEQIESNRRRSAVLVAGMAAVLVALGAVIGGATGRGEGAGLGAVAAVALWLVLWLIAVFRGDRIMLGIAGARKIEKEDAPRLFNVVEEMTIASGLGRMPEIWIIPDESPNAFAAGRTPETRVVAVTSGLMKILDRDQLQGVIAHEMAHHKNRDTSLMVLMGVMLGAIILLADLFLRTAWRPRRSRSRDSGGAQAALAIVAILAAVLAPIAAQVLYFACSRRREYLADASAARFTRYPAGLAGALASISGHYTTRRQANRVLAPLYIVNPMQAFVAATGLFSTHPPTEDRIRILRSMGGAGFAAYNEAFRRLHASGPAPVGARSLSADSPVPIRPPEAAPEGRKEAGTRSEEVHGMLGRLDGLTSFRCPCGVGIKVPPEAAWKSVPCPRCGRENEVPRPRAGADAAPEYRRLGSGWESFQCACGSGVQLSPAFSASRIDCPRCGRSTRIVA
jgi:heat shock protein HtpX